VSQKLAILRVVCRPDDRYSRRAYSLSMYTLINSRDIHVKVGTTASYFADIIYQALLLNL